MPMHYKIPVNRASKAFDISKFGIAARVVLFAKDGTVLVSVDIDENGKGASPVVNPGRYDRARVFFSSGCSLPIKIKFSTSDNLLKLEEFHIHGLNWG